MSESTARFRFVNYKIKESSIKISTDKQLDPHINVKFDTSTGTIIDGHKMRLDLATTITNGNETLTISVKAEGYFEFDNDITQELQDKFFKINAPAILFPYIRAYISTLTSLSGIETIILPTLNISRR